MSLRVLDMFCGAGGSSAGARMAGAVVAGGIDAWDVATQTYSDNFAGAKVQLRRMGSHSRAGRAFAEGEIDLLLASPECTNHSPAKGAAERSETSKSTSHYVLRFAAKLKPRYLVLENVVQLRNWHGYHPLLNGLVAQGYRHQAHVLDAADFGVPQARRRLFVVCDRDQEPVSRIEERGERRNAEEILKLDGRHASRPLRSLGRALGTLERAERGIAALGLGVPFLVVYYGSDGAGGWQRVDRPLRTLTTLDRFGLVTWEGSEPMLRMLQVDELREAMGLPSNHVLARGTRRDQIKLLGNGVCAPVMHAIVDSLQ